MKPNAWESKYSVGVEEIDRQHLRFFEMLREVEVLIGDGAFAGFGDQRKRDLYLMLLRLRRYALQHLSMEEELLLSWRYPDYLAHKREHNHCIRTMLEMEERVAAGEMAVAIKLRNFLKDWWGSHILNTDRKYMPYAKEPTAEDFLRQGASLREEKNFGEAYKAFSKAIEKEPGKAQAYYLRGVLLAAMGKYQDSQKDLRLAARMGDPDAVAFLGGTPVEEASDG